MGFGDPDAVDDAVDDAPAVFFKGCFGVEEDFAGEGVDCFVAFDPPELRV